MESALLKVLMAIKQVLNFHFTNLLILTILFFMGLYGPKKIRIIYLKLQVDDK